MSTDSNNFLSYKCITAHVLCEGYTNQKLINSPGLYFENLGPISYYTSTWDLVAHIDISQQTNHLTTVKISLKEKSLYEFLGTSRTKRGLFNGIGTIF